jgi:hypothetical protein
MSSAIAAARKRRAGIQQNDPIKNPIPPSNVAQGQPTQGGAQSGLTLPQVIALVDKRLVILEKFMSEAKVQLQESKDAKPRVRFEEPPQVQTPSTTLHQPQPLDSLPSLSEVNEILDDYHNRFILLTQEIADLKDIILKLQSYTMDVNKMLVEERVFIGSNTISIPSDETQEEDQPEEGQELTEEPEQKPIEISDVYDPIQNSSVDSTEQSESKYEYNPNITHTLEPIEE